MKTLHFAAAAILFCTTPVFAQPLQIARCPLITRWAKEVSPTNALPEYPRPSLVRANWQSLKGLWS